MREGTGLMIIVGTVMAYFGITWIIYDWITKPIAEIIISFFSLKTEGSLNEGITKLATQTLLPIIIASFSYAIIKIISDINKDIKEFLQERMK